MGAFNNPLTGASWGTQAQENNNSLLNPLNIQGPPGIGTAHGQGTDNGNFGAGGYGNPGNFRNPSGGRETSRNIMLDNIITGQMRNQLIPQFANAMSGYAGPAGDFFKNLMNLGSPYYQQKQQEGLTQGVQQNQNAGAQARDQLRSEGYGATPSGATAAMLGGMAMQGSQSLSEQYLKNLFQNENLQALGAQGLTQLAGMFNPSSLFGTQGAGADPQMTSSFFQNLNSVMDAISKGTSAAGGNPFGGN